MLAKKDKSDQDKATGAAAVIDPPSLTFISEEKLKVILDSSGLKEFKLSGLLRLAVANLKNKIFKVKIKNRGSPNIKFHVNSSKFDRGIFAHKGLLVSLGDKNAFPPNSRPLHWSWTLNKKDESNVPIKVKCEASAAGGETTVMIDYKAFSLFNLENVQISVPIKSGEAHIDEPVDGRCWYDPGNTKGQGKVHWSIPAIGDKNRDGLAMFTVSGVVKVSQFFPIEVKFKATATYSNLKLTIIPSKKQSVPSVPSVPPEFVHHTQLETEDKAYEIKG